MNQRKHKRRACSVKQHCEEFKGSYERGYTDKRCKSYEMGCYTCDMWRFFDERGRFPYNFEEQFAYMDSINPDRRVTYVNQSAN